MARTTIKKTRRLEIYNLDGFECVYCGRVMIVGDGQLTLDHLHPVSLGGRNTVANMVTACKGCNHARGPGDIPIDRLRFGRFSASGHRGTFTVASYKKIRRMLKQSNELSMATRNIVKLLTDDQISRSQRLRHPLTPTEAGQCD